MVKEYFLKNNNKMILFVLLVGFLNGLVYIFIIPPWQHYDEMSHFEYAWMIANQDSFPKKGEFDNNIRAEILDSMKENRFFDLQKYAKGFESIADDYDPIWIGGITQVGDPPIYYLFAALPLKLLKGLPIETQLYLARFVSLLFLLGILYIAYLFGKEILPSGSNFIWLFPLSLALFPAFVDNMTALNNDVGGVFFVSLVLLYGVKVIKNPDNWKKIFILLILMVILYFVKVSVWIVIFPILLLFVYLLVKHLNRWILLGVLGVFLLISLVVFFDFNDAALWYRNTKQIEPTRIETDFGFAIFVKNDLISESTLYQTVPMKNSRTLSGQIITVGAWIWADEEVQIIPPSIIALDARNERTILRPDHLISIGQTPQFFSTHYQLPEQVERIVLELHSGSVDYRGVYYQQPILVLGEQPGNIPPTIKKESVIWNDKPLVNFVRNVELDQRWPRFSPLMIKIFNKIDYRISEAANWILYSMDLQGAGWYTKFSMVNIFRTFWGKFGWGHVLLLGRSPYWYPLIFSIVGITASIYFLLKNMSLIKVRVIVWFGLVLSSLLFFAWFTGISMQSYFSWIILPGARFIYPGILGWFGVIVFGWSWLMELSSKRIAITARLFYALFFVYINSVSLLTVYRYFH